MASGSRYPTCQQGQPTYSRYGVLVVISNHCTFRLLGRDSLRRRTPFVTASTAKLLGRHQTTETRGSRAPPSRQKEAEHCISFSSRHNIANPPFSPYPPLTTALAGPGKSSRPGFLLRSLGVYLAAVGGLGEAHETDRRECPLDHLPLVVCESGKRWPWANARIEAVLASSRRRFHLAHLANPRQPAERTSGRPGMSRRPSPPSKLANVQGDRRATTLATSRLL